MDLTTAVTILSTLGAAEALRRLSLRVYARGRWERFEAEVDRWLDVGDGTNPKPGAFREMNRASAARTVVRLLSDAGFTPEDIVAFQEIAIDLLLSKWDDAGKPWSDDGQ